MSDNMPFIKSNTEQTLDFGTLDVDTIPSVWLFTGHKIQIEQVYEFKSQARAIMYFDHVDYVERKSSRVVLTFDHGEWVQRESSRGVVTNVMVHFIAPLDLVGAVVAAARQLPGFKSLFMPERKVLPRQRPITDLPSATWVLCRNSASTHVPSSRALSKVSFYERLFGPDPEKAADIAGTGNDSRSRVAGNKAETGADLLGLPHQHLV
ncbi:hypothetical protein PaG_06476 [Moesziomyces aphidis]|jgi:hypothetical protein|uniref:Uncharacterized protein n=1 Tax=Moesziomyces aphidis TaxID=84754 RepID=W3VFN8_MOEAP|nr:hypothetical protein PaG_06476 [Moesziomyces aphidis]